jgi:hypothetical protein
MRPPQSGPVRMKPLARVTPYSPPTSFHQQQHPAYRATTVSSSSSHRTTAGFEHSFSPFPGLTTAQVKKLEEQFENPQTKVDLISEVCQQLYGDAPEQDDLLRALAEPSLHWTHVIMTS